MGPCGSTDLSFCRSQPGTSRNHRTTDTGLVHHVVCPFNSACHPSRSVNEYQWKLGSKRAYHTMH